MHIVSTVRGHGRSPRPNSPVHCSEEGSLCLLFMIPKTNLELLFVFQPWHLRSLDSTPPGFTLCLLSDVQHRANHTISIERDRKGRAVEPNAATVFGRRSNLVKIRSRSSDINQRYDQDLSPRGPVCPSPRLGIFQTETICHFYYPGILSSSRTLINRMHMVLPERYPSIHPTLVNSQVACTTVMTSADSKQFGVSPLTNWRPRIKRSGQVQICVDRSRPNFPRERAGTEERMEESWQHA